MKVKLLMVGLVTGILACGVACNSRSDHFDLTTRVRQARMHLSNFVDVPCPVAQQWVINDVDHALNLTILSADPIAFASSGANGDMVRSWVKFRIVETWHDRPFGVPGKAPPSIVPPELLPLARNEFAIWDCGGMVTIRGVRVVQHGRHHDFRLGNRYLLFILPEAQVAQIAGWKEGVFLIDGGTLRPIDAYAAMTGLDREIEQRFGNQVQKLRAYLGEHP